MMSLIILGASRLIYTYLKVTKVTYLPVTKVTNLYQINPTKSD